MTNLKKTPRLALFAAFGMAMANGAAASDTSIYLGNNKRTAYTDAVVPAEPALVWTYTERHPPRHAWREPNRELQYIDFDYATQTTIAGGMVFFGSSADHTVRALNADTGEEKWSFVTEGPVRFAPVAHQGWVYVASDDGFLYCLEASSGELIWRFRGGPSARKSIGNDQLISHWPARSGVLIEEDKLYFTAGMWSRDGVFIYCLDPQDAAVIWRNDTSGYHFTTLPHSSGFAGVAPQGYLALHRGRLYVPTGRGAPACFDAGSGEFIFYENGHGYKPHQPGGSRVMAWKDWVIMKRRSQHTEESVRYEERGPGKGAASGLYALDGKTGKPAWSLTDKNIAAARGDALILGGQGPVIRVDISDVLTGYEKYWKDGKPLGYDSNIPDAEVNYTRSGQGKLIPNPAWMSPLPFKKWSADVGERVFVLLQAGDTVLAGGRGVVSAINAVNGNVLWQKELEGDARGISVADGRILVSTTTGKLYCFGDQDEGGGAARQIVHKTVKPTTDAKAADLAEKILRTGGVRAGYALMLGVGDGQLLYELLDRSELVVYCLEPDEAKVAIARKRLDDASLLGVRAAVHHGAFDELSYSPYFANLILWGEELDSGVKSVNVADLYRVLRPYGGVAIQLGNGGAKEGTARKLLSAGGIPEAEINTSPLGLLVKRGELPGSGQWTHAHANIGRTGSSQDTRIQLPLGMLWWGGPGPDRIVSRHWRAPAPVFANGVLYVQGQHDVIAVDAYNGREMWNRHLKNVGRFPPTHRGGNIVGDKDGVYCVVGLKCMLLDAQTGNTSREFAFPLKETHERAMSELTSGNTFTSKSKKKKAARSVTEPASKARIVWEYLGVSGNRIIGTLGSEQVLMEGDPMPKTSGIQQSSHIFAFDKTTGELLWEHEVDRAVGATAIVADDHAVYLLDRDADVEADRARRRGETVEIASALKALDLDTGELLWTREGIPPAWKTLMLGNGCIVTYPNTAEVMAQDGDKGVGVFLADNGKPLWSKDEMKGIAETGRGGTMRHTFIVGDTLFLPWAHDLCTGEEKLLEQDPLTGDEKKFDVSGKNFCGSIAAADNLLIYRSASIGFAEIGRDSGSHWLPEARPSCWISAIPAGGMVLAPEGYSTCICPYNYKTSMALIPTERHENWSVYLEGGRREKKAGAIWKKNKARGKAGPKIVDVKHLRVNLNAPGDQMDERGNLWLAWPRPVDPKNAYFIQPVPVQHTVGASTEAFRFNADYFAVAGTADPWLYTSGFEGTAPYLLTLSAGKEHRYSVRLHFAETKDALPGERVFDVKIGGETVLSDVDVAREAGGPRKALIKKVAGVNAAGTMKVELVPVKGKPPVLCSLEVIRE